MCGRYVIVSSPESVRALFGYDEQPNFPPRYNIAPTQPVPIVRLVGAQAPGAQAPGAQAPGAQAPEGRRSFGLVRWGLIPAWVKDPRGFSLLINARGESVLDKPAFQNAMRRRRCLFPADGFYEWQRAGRDKRPFFVRPKQGAPIALAGLWETWMGPNGEELDTAAIVTTRANRTLAPLHERMPVVVPRDAFDFWLDCVRVDGETAAALIAPAPEEALEAYEVSPAVNHAGNDSADLVVPLAATTLGRPAVAARPGKKKRSNETQGSLF
jgi:putative SOS response-associated peptidase YedK